MAKNWYPIINYSLCTDCKACIEKCKNGVYDKEASSPQVIYPDGCRDQCRGCQDLCPTGAISYFGDIGQAGLTCCT